MSPIEEATEEQLQRLHRLVDKMHMGDVNAMLRWVRGRVEFPQYTTDDSLKFMEKKYGR